MDTITSISLQIKFEAYTIVVGNSILIYDHLATLPEEIAFIWRRPKAMSAMLFLLNRYFALLVNICALAMDFLPMSDESCPKYELYREVALLFQAIIVCLIMTIRTYALYGGSKRLLTWMTIIMISLAVAVSVGALGHFSGNTDQTIFSADGCNETYTAETAARLGLAWMAELIFELLIFILIVYRICKTRGLLWSSLFTRRNIINIIFHDGAMYFGAMALVNIPNILTYYTSSVIARGGLSVLTSCMSATLISRLMLNLHKTIDTGICSTARDDGPSLAVLTTMVNVQSPISSHDW